MLLPIPVLTNVRLPFRTLANAPTAAPTLESDAQGVVDEYGCVSAYISAGCVGTLYIFNPTYKEWVTSGESTAVANKTFGAANKLGYWAAPPGAKACIVLDTGSLTVKHNLKPIVGSLAP